MIKKIAFLMSPSLVFLGGCDHLSSWGNNSEVALPDLPPLETQELVRVASTCRKETESLEKRSKYVPKARQGEFTTVLRMASDNCGELETTLERLKQATHQKEGFSQNMQHAESAILQNEKKPSSAIKESPLDLSEFEPDDSSEIVSEPLR